jgi:hypothetical protein
MGVYAAARDQALSVMPTAGLSYQHAKRRASNIDMDLDSRIDAARNDEMTTIHFKFPKKMTPQINAFGRGCRKRRVQIALDAQAIFCRRRHQPRRPPPAKIRPGSPAPGMGPGTGTVTLATA